MEVRLSLFPSVLLACLATLSNFIPHISISHLRNVGPANYTLKYNVMPYVGMLTYGEAARTVDSVPFPEQRSEVA